MRRRRRPPLHRVYRRRIPTLFYRGRRRRRRRLLKAKRFHLKLLFDGLFPVSRSLPTILARSHSHLFRLPVSYTLSVSLVSLPCRTHRDDVVSPRPVQRSFSLNHSHSLSLSLSIYLSIYLSHSHSLSFSLFCSRKVQAMLRVRARHP